MTIKNILYLFILTNITMPYIFTMEEQSKEQAKEEIEFEKDQELINWLKSNPEIYDALKVFYRIPLSEEYILPLGPTTYCFPLELARKIVEDVRIYNDNMAYNNGKALLAAIDANDYEEANQLLRKPYINVNVQDESGDTPLLIVIATKRCYRDQKWIEIAKMLQQKGANLDLQVVVQKLLQKCANPDLQDNRRMTALDMATMNNTHK